MTPILQLLIALAVIVAAAKLAGLASVRLGQPAVLGEILIGLILGPSVLNLYALPFLNDPHLPETIAQLAEIGVIFLMFLAGLEVDLGSMRRSGKVVLLAGVGGVLVPWLLGTVTARPFGFSWQQAVFIGLLLTATSVSISAQTLFELGVIRSKEGIALLGAAVVDDVLVIFLVSLALALSTGSGAGVMDVVWLVVRMALYIGLFSLIGQYLVPRWLAQVDRWRVSQGLVAATVVIVFIYAWAAEVLGNIALITGAFLAGVFVARSNVHQPIETGMRALTYGLFVPIFFVNIGLTANVLGLSGSLLWLTVLISLIAVIGKVVGSGLGAMLGGFSLGESLRLGTGMISRGEVGLIVASLIVSNGLVPFEILSLAVVMVLVTTLVTPPLLRLVFRNRAVVGEPRQQAISD